MDWKIYLYYWNDSEATRSSIIPVLCSGFIIVLKSTLYCFSVYRTSQADLMIFLSLRAEERENE